MKIDSADKTSIEILDGNDFGNIAFYALDRFRVNFKGSVIADAEPSAFQYFTASGYSKDKYNVYLDWFKIVLADP